MPVEMLRDARPRHRAEIQPDIQAVAAQGRFQYAGQPREEQTDFGHLALVQCIEGSDLSIGDDHAMAGVVGIEIHQDEGACPAVENEVLPVVGGIGGDRTEDTDARWGRATFSPDVAHAPGCPEPLRCLVVRLTHTVRVVSFSNRPLREYSMGK